MQPQGGFIIKDERNILYALLNMYATFLNVKSFECEIFDFKGDLASP